MPDNGYQVLARKWRPQRFEDVVGQEHVTRTLKNAIAQGRIPHAFLFIGSRGIGKTTTARILAKSLNCVASEVPTPEPCGTCENCTAIGRGSSIDVIEIDGASNNGVDDVREIRENIRMVPTSGRYKVYIIDEVHQLSQGAFNALLKTLEEPPPHGVFVLATTEAHKVPATIISRCQRYDFRRVEQRRIVKLLRDIATAEGVQVHDDALHAVARAAEGGVRDAESIFDQLISYCTGEITYQDVLDVLGLIDWAVLHKLCDAMVPQDITTQLEIVEDVAAQGKDLSAFVQDLLQYLRGLLLCKTADAAKLTGLPEDEVQALAERAAHFQLTQLIRLIEDLAETTKGFDWQSAQRIALETFLIRVSKVTVERSVDGVLEKLLQLEARSGSAPPNPRPAAPAPSGTPAAASPAPQPKPRAVPAPKAVPAHTAASAPKAAPASPSAPRPAREPAVQAAAEPPADTGYAAAPTVDREQARLALADPTVAAIRSVFRGQVVRVDPPASADDLAPPD